MTRVSGEEEGGEPTGVGGRLSARYIRMPLTMPTGGQGQDEPPPKAFDGSPSPSCPARREASAGTAQHDWPRRLCGEQGCACGRPPTHPDIDKPARNKRFSQLVFGWRRRQPNRPLGGTTGSWPSLWTLLLSGVPGGAQRIRPAAQPRQAGMGRWALPSISPSSSDLVILLMPTRAVDLGVDGTGPRSLVDLHSPASNSSGCSAQPLSPVLPLSPFPGHLFFFCKILGRCAGWLGPPPTVLVPDK